VHEDLWRIRLCLSDTPGRIGRNALQGGFEVQSGWYAGHHVQYYWANDLQSWERAQWNPMYNSQAGCTLADKPGDSVRFLFFWNIPPVSSPRDSSISKMKVAGAWGLDSAQLNVIDLQAFVSSIIRPP